MGTMTTIRIVGGPLDGEHSGRSPESIVRRLYGRNAIVYWSSDPNDPYEMIVRKAKHEDNAYVVLGRFLKDRKAW